MQKYLLITTIAAGLLSGCTNDHTEDHGTTAREYYHDTGAGSNIAGSEDNHDHDEVSLLLTAYSDKFEIFAETDPLAQGVISEMLVHITRTGNFKPVTDGKVTMILSSGGGTVSQTREGPDRPGIFRFSIQPETTGDATIRFIIETTQPLETSGVQESVTRSLPDTEAATTQSPKAQQLSEASPTPAAGHITDTIKISGLRVYTDRHMALHAAEELHREHPGAVTFTKEQSWTITFATEKAARQPFGPVLKTVGTLQPALGDEIILTAQSAGIISFTDNNLYEGKSLRSGESLLEVQGGSLAEGNAAVRYAEAQNNHKRALADYLRMSALAKERIASEKELLQAENDYLNTLAIFESLKDNFSKRGQTVSVPFDSYISNLYVSSGQFVEAGAPLARVSRLQRHMIRAEVQQRYAHLLETVYTANIVSGSETYNLEQLGGEIVQKGREVSPRSPLIPIHLQIDAGHGIFPGSLLDIYLKTHTGDKALVIPSTALVEEQGYYFVYVQIHPESFEKREVQTGGSDGYYTEITGGLAENERIVTLGSAIVKAAATTGNIDAHSGHVH